MGRFADALLDEIAHRGSDATGLMTLSDNGHVWIEKKTFPARSFIKMREPFPADARTVLLHVRLATRGSKRNPRNAHPVASGNVAAIHNGTIHNADELFETFRLPRIGTVDSEIIPALVNLAGWDQAARALELMSGGAATAIVHQEHPREVLLAKTHSWPLVYVATKDLVIWASTEQAIRRAWKRTYGKALKARAHRLDEGSILHINGKLIESTFTVKRAPAYKPIVSHKKKGKAKNRPAGTKRWRGQVVTKSPATQMLDAVESPSYDWETSAELLAEENAVMNIDRYRETLDHEFVCMDCGEDAPDCTCDSSLWTPSQLKAAF